MFISEKPYVQKGKLPRIIDKLEQKYKKTDFKINDEVI